MFENFLLYAVDEVLPYAKRISIAALIVAIAGGALTAIAANQHFKKYVKIALSALFFYALVMGILLLVLDVIKHYDAAYLNENYVNKEVTTLVLIPIAATLSLILIGAVVVYFTGRTGSEETEKRFRTTLTVTGLVIAAAIAATLVTILIYYTRNIAGDGYYTAEGARFNEIALYVIAAVLFAGTIAAAFIIDKNSPPFSTRMIARAGVAVALSFAFSYVKLFQLPQGGAVTLASSLPIMLFAFSYGPKKGLMIGFVYGMLQAVQDPFIIHPAQFLLDYPVAFTMYGLAGAFVRTRLPVQVNFTLGAILSSAMRFAAHVVSGVFAFGAYAEGAGAENFLLYSLAYNSFVFVDVAIALALGILLLSNRAIRKLLIGAADEEKDVKSILKSDDPSPQNDADTDL